MDGVAGAVGAERDTVPAPKTKAQDTDLARRRRN